MPGDRVTWSDGGTKHGRGGHELRKFLPGGHVPRGYRHGISRDRELGCMGGRGWCLMLRSVRDGGESESVRQMEGSPTHHTGSGVARK